MAYLIERPLHLFERLPNGDFKRGGIIELSNGARQLLGDRGYVRVIPKPYFEEITAKNYYEGDCISSLSPEPIEYPPVFTENGNIMGVFIPSTNKVES